MTYTVPPLLCPALSLSSNPEAASRNCPKNPFPFLPDSPLWIAGIFAILPEPLRHSSHTRSEKSSIRRPLIQERAPHGRTSNGYCVRPAYRRPAWPFCIPGGMLYFFHVYDFDSSNGDLHDRFCREILQENYIISFKRNQPVSLPIRSAFVPPK